MVDRVPRNECLSLSIAQGSQCSPHTDPGRYGGVITILRDIFHLFHIIHMATGCVKVLVVSLGSWRTIVATRDSDFGIRTQGGQYACVLWCRISGGGPGEWLTFLLDERLTTAIRNPRQERYPERSAKRVYV